ncbi:DUF7824 domain-containing protein [Microtetraspora niveoalba]|uniref:DUF7824 domain-containing protein n=1 Tax=Microtetraspora niveoalba TaxID=46175 RepID=UPI00083685AE|nr:DUF6493 family protein [Microtetraspora niveoalba]
MSAWERVRKIIADGDASLMADEVLSLDEAGRREVARELPGHIGSAGQDALERYERRRAEATLAGERDRKKFVRAEMARGASSDEAHHTWWLREHQRREYWVDWSERERWVEPMRVAGAGTIGGAAAVATWLYRRDFARGRTSRDLRPLLQVIAARPSEWQADLAVRLALRLRGSRAQARDDSAELALELLRRTGAVPPAHDPLVVAWVSAPPALEHDPLTEHLLPRIFEAEGVGRALREDRADPPEWAPDQPSWLRSLRDLADAGRVGRDVLIDGCVRRFLLGGNAPDLRFFVRLHDLLDPEPRQERSRDYLRLLPAAPGPVAELALRQLRRAGGLSGDEVNEALSALLFRAEGKLVRAGLTWLDRAARDAGDDLDHLAPALASAFLSESFEVQERSVRLAVKHASRFSPVGAEAVREAAAVLPADLAARLSEAYGEVDSLLAEADDFRAVPLPSFEAPVRKPFPPALGDLAGTYAELDDVVTVERWLDGFVREPAARKAPRPKDPEHGGDGLSGRHWSRPEEWVEALLREAAAPGQEPPAPEPARPHAAGGSVEADVDRLLGPNTVSLPHRAMLLRCAEIHAALKAGTLPPYLLATPTLTSGHIEPAELVARLEGYERAGVRALPADLQQALLRLPREVDPGVADRAARLTSEAGATLARWLKERPEPAMRVDWFHAGGDYADDREPANLNPRLRPRIRLEPTGLALVDALLADPPSSRWHGHGAYMAYWRLMLPSDREAVAMHLLPFLLDGWGRPDYFHQYVGELFHQDGPMGEGVAVLVAVLLAERGWYGSVERGQELLLRAAAAGHLPATECGRQLGLVLRRMSVRPSDVMSSLEDCARKGAHREVWDIMAGLLPVYLPGPGERPHSGHTQALTFAVEAARWADARDTLPAVAEIAGRKGTSGFVRAAQLLHRRLGATHELEAP